MFAHKTTVIILNGIYMILAARRLLIEGDTIQIYTY